MPGRPEAAGFGTPKSYPLQRQLYLWSVRDMVAAAGCAVWGYEWVAIVTTYSSLNTT